VNNINKLKRDEIKVAVVYRLDHPGGVQSVAFALIRGLNQFGITPHVLWDVPPDQELLKDKRVKVNYQPIRFLIPSPVIDRLPNSIRYLAWMFNCIKGEEQKNIYHFYYVFYNGFLLKASTPHLRYLSGPPLLPQLWKTPKGVRGWPVRGFSWFYRHWFRKKCPVYDYHRDNQYVINSRYTAELFQEAHGVNLPVIYPPIQMTGRAYEEDDLEKRDTVTFFSRIVDYKRPDLMLGLAERFPNNRYVIMGAVPEHRIPFLNQLKKEAENKNLQNVVFYANPSDEIVRDVLARTRFYIFPAQNEHFGMTTVEAIASGAIPFVHNSGGQKEIVHNAILRFDYAHFFDKFNELQQKNCSELKQLRIELSDHVQQFSEENAVGKMLHYLKNSDSVRLRKPGDQVGNFN
jgi:glycosyltransferase involved in cell wall biosynthesis